MAKRSKLTSGEFTGFLFNITLQRDKVASFKDYPFSIPAIESIETLKLHPKVTFFIGENGSGKSTLLEAVAVANGFNAEGGSRNFNFSTRDSHSSLANYLWFDRNLTKPTDGYFFRAESYFNVATAIEKMDEPMENVSAPPIIDSYGGRSLHEQSHGESFFALLTRRLRGGGLYLFDEPEAALSPTRQMSCVTLMHDLLKTDSQFIIATHSPILMAYPHATIYEFSEKGIARVAYEDTEHYRVTRDFLNKRKMMLKILMEDET